MSSYFDEDGVMYARKMIKIGYLLTHSTLPQLDSCARNCYSSGRAAGEYKTMGKIGISVVVLFAGVMAYGAISNHMANRPVFYRATIEFESRGQKGVLDAVVKCDVRARQTLSGEKFNDYYPNPVLYAVKLPDGSGVMARVGNNQACDRAWRHLHNDPYWERKRDGIPEMPYSGMPRLTWLRDFATKDYAEIYLGQASYEQPNSNLRYQKALVSSSSEGEYQSWRARVDQSKDDYIYDIDRRGAQSKVFASFGPIVAENCIYNQKVFRQVWGRDEQINDWAQTSTGNQLYVLPVNLSERIVKLFGREYLEVSAQNSGGYYTPEGGADDLLIQQGKFDLADLLKTIYPVIHNGSNYEVDYSKYGVIACGAKTRELSNQAQQSIEITSRGRTTQRLFESGFYYDPSDQSINHVRINGPIW